MAPLLHVFSRLAIAGLAFVSTAQAVPLACPRPNEPAGSSALIVPDAAAAGRVPLRLMPLGASITWGLYSTDENGYRETLHNLLTKEGYVVDMVGSRQHGTMKDNANEGWPGLRIDQVEVKARAAVPSRLPNVFTVNVGTNDCVQDFDINRAGDRMNDLVEYLWKASPGSTIILSTLVLNLNNNDEARVLKVNDQIRALVTRRAAAGGKIVLAEMHGADGPQRADIGPDGTHPDNGGYDKMGKVWYRSIQNAASKGFLQPPRHLP